MKILNAGEIRQADAWTIEHEPIASLDLMERAATGLYGWIIGHSEWNEGVRCFHIFCGTGNNGGDGLVLARLLNDDNLKVSVHLVRLGAKASDDFNANIKRLPDSGIKAEDIKSGDMPELGDDDVVVDAIFGSGLNRPAEGLAAEVIAHINAAPARVIAVDMPSGLFSEDNSTNDRKAIIHADVTLSFQVPRLAMMFAENNREVGEWHLINIGLDEAFIESLPVKRYYVTRSMIRSIYRPRPKFSHKGSFGHALIIAGAYGRMGAACLAAHACMRSGVGLLTTYIPACGYNIMQSWLPEAMALTDLNEQFITDIPPLAPYHAVGVGPGIGMHEDSACALKTLIQNTHTPLVIDADAINILGENKTWLAFLPHGSILTPHPREFERLAGRTSDHYSRDRLASELAVKHGIYILIKGAHTSIACPDGAVYYNSTGNPGMATGGSGDVLTGIITGLMAQGYDSLQSAVLGVYLHGLAGDIAGGQYGRETMTARDIIEHLSHAFRIM